MEACRLIQDSRSALLRASSAADLVAEARQVQALVEALGSHVAAAGPPALRVEAARLSEAGMQGCAPSCRPGRAGGGFRAVRLTRVADLHTALGHLSVLLGETVAALVRASASAEQPGAYWQGIEAIDAADESADRVAAVLRCLALPERGPAA
ncbi:DUF6099 family protein [Streptomyces sp. TR02-1]|uniref:DUF6099 family protein n=1 Tax=Streptomyces sp. TR02-1 TaxID=3385977 RepID=UPI0039A32DCF